MYDYLREETEMELIKDMLEENYTYYKKKEKKSIEEKNYAEDIDIRKENNKKNNKKNNY